MLRSSRKYEHFSNTVIPVFSIKGNFINNSSSWGYAFVYKFQKLEARTVKLILLD